MGGQKKKKGVRRNHRFLNQNQTFLQQKHHPKRTNQNHQVLKKKKLKRSGSPQPKKKGSKKKDKNKTKSSKKKDNEQKKKDSEAGKVKINVEKPKIVVETLNEERLYHSRKIEGVRPMFDPASLTSKKEALKKSPSIRADPKKAAKIRKKMAKRKKNPLGRASLQNSLQRVGTQVASGSKIKSAIKKKSITNVYARNILASAASLGAEIQNGHSIREHGQNRAQIALDIKKKRGKRKRRQLGTIRLERAP